MISRAVPSVLGSEGRIRHRSLLGCGHRPGVNGLTCRQPQTTPSVESHRGKGSPKKQESRTEFCGKQSPIKTKWEINTKRSLKKYVLPDPNCFLVDNIYSRKTYQLSPFHIQTKSWDDQGLKQNSIWDVDVLGFVTGTCLAHKFAGLRRRSSPILPLPFLKLTKRWSTN